MSSLWRYRFKYAQRQASLNLAVEQNIRTKKDGESRLFRCAIGFKLYSELGFYSQQIIRRKVDDLDSVIIYTVVAVLVPV